MSALVTAPLGLASAQGPSTVVSPVVRHASGAALTAAATDVTAQPLGIPRPLRLDSDEAPAKFAPRWAPLASLVVPGSGQLMMRQSRGVAYAVAEIYALVQAVEAIQDANARRSEYHRTAREVARNGFAISAEGPWKYYEDMYDFVASGAYNRTPGRGTTPEIDTTTYNGALWQNARRIYWANPEVAPAPTDSTYQRAVSFYERSAWRDGYLWSWRDQQGEWLLFKSTHVRENQASRDFTASLIVIIGNHLLSAVDAFATVRVRRTVGTRSESKVEVSVPWPSRR